MRKFLIYIICGLMTLGVFLPSIVKAADQSEDMVTISFEGKYADGKNMTIKKGSKITSADTEKLLSKKGYSYYGTFTDAAFKNRFDYNTVIENNITLYPEISLVKYNIYFYRNEDSETKYIGNLNNYVSVENPQMPTLEKDFYNLFDNKVSDYKNPRTGKVYTFAEVYDINGFRVSGYDYKSLNDVPELQEKHLENADVNSISVEFLVKKKKLTVTFVPGNGKDNFTIEASFGEWVKKSPKDPTREGYKFLGWYDGDKVFTPATSKIYEDTTLTTKWEKENFDKYKVSFVLEGEDIKDQKVEFDTNATEPKVDPKKGYEFDGWYTDSDFKNKFDFSSPIRGDLTLYARWDKKKYTVSFVLDQENIPNQEVEFDSQAKEPTIEDKEDFEFDGWYTDPGFTKKFDFSSPIKSKLTLYARWKKKKYTVSFVLEGEEISNQNVEFDSQAKEPTIEDKEGFEFDGWYTDSEFKNEFDFSNPVKSDLTLYARWNKKKYTVSFVLKGKDIPSQKVEFDLHATEPRVETKEGFKFDGWYTDKEFKNKFNFSDPIKNDLSLYARWNKKKYNVSFVLEGKDIPSQEVEFNSQASKPKVDPKDGFEFDGWYTDKEFKSKFNFSDPIKSDMILYARWAKKKYTVSFMLEGENIPNQEVEFDSQAKEPTIETKEGLEFDGWYTDSEFTSKFDFSSPIKSKLTLYARWNKIEQEKPNPDEKEEPGENPNPDDNKNPDETEEPGKDDNKNPDEDKKPDDNKESDDQKNPDINNKPDNNEEPGHNDNNDRPSYDYKYDYYDYYRYPNYDYLNSNKNNSSDIAKNKDDNKSDKAEEKTKDENKEEIIEEKVTIPEAILNSYFSDIGDLPGDYQEAIIDLANRSVLIGTGKNNFDPHTSISRAMVAQVLYRLANDKAYVNPSDFTDSAPTNWFYTAVNWANEKGLVEGFKDKTFKPNKSITNEELAVILARAIEKLELKTTKINSIDKSDYKFLADWNRDGIIKMLELDLMDFTFENNQVVVKEISRAEFANIIYKLINSLN